MVIPKYDSLVEFCDITSAVLLAAMFVMPRGLQQVYTACWSANVSCLLWDDFVTVLCCGDKEIEIYRVGYEEIPYYSILYPH
jgi:hypothetical protein